MFHYLFRDLARPLSACGLLYNGLCHAVLRGAGGGAAVGVGDISICYRRDHRSVKEQKEFYTTLMNVCFLFQMNNVHGSGILCFLGGLL